MVIVLITGPKISRFKPSGERCIFKGVKIRSTSSFGGEVKPSAPCRNILRHVKDPFRYDRDTDRQNYAAISRLVSPLFATRCLCCNQRRELWRMNRK
jgi:hypothetical protein